MRQKKVTGRGVYVRIPNGTGSYEVLLLCAKSRAPIMTLPRLELCGALLLARLMQRISVSFKIDREYLYFWCDLMIVLHYIAAEFSRWATFVANFITEIQEITNRNWRHVPTAENPAALASRDMDNVGYTASL